MSVSEKDIKKLWGLAAGKCSHPECHLDCVQFLDLNDPTVIGEMAHIIAQSKKGPRNTGKSAGEDSYENLILLCPTHHTIIDKAPENKFPIELLLEWKKNHEEKVKSLFETQSFSNKIDLFTFIKRILIKNKALWQQYGPESKISSENPISSAAKLWSLRKLDFIIPNNSKISQVIEQNEQLLNLNELEVANLFIEHAKLFEANSYNRMDSNTVPRFPIEFEKLIDEVLNV